MPLKFQDFARCFTGSKRAPASASASASPPEPEPVPAVSLPDDLLCEILLRLPPLPSTLPRASLVCKHWRCLVADPFFLRRFRQHHHHRTPPPLLGYFFSDPHGPVFVPTRAAPDCFPPERFSLPRLPGAEGERLFFLGCRNGLALLINRRRLHAIVWDPATGCRATVAYPPEFTTDNGAHCCRGAVLGTAAATADGDGQLRLRPFKVILIRTDELHDGRIRVSMCVYESQTGEWGCIVVATTTIPSSVSNLHNVLVGNALCGFLRWPNAILELDLERHSVGVIQTPKSLRHLIDRSFFQVVRTQDGELGLAVLSRRMGMELWRREAMANYSSSDGVAGWVLQKAIQLDKLLPLPRLNMMDNNLAARMLGFDEDNNVILVSTLTGGAFAIQLNSMQFKELFNVKGVGSYQACHPYTGFYTAGVPRLPTAA